MIAYLTSITLLPALLTVLNPPGEPEPLGFPWLAPVDRFMERHRIAIIVGVAAGVARRAAAALFSAVRFQSDQPAQPAGRIDRDLPRSAPRSDHRRERDQTCWRPISPRRARSRSACPSSRRCRRSSRSTTSFRPTRTQKLAAIKAARDKIEPSFKPEAAQKPPTDEENVASLDELPSASLNEAAGKHQGRAPTPQSACGRLSPSSPRRRREMRSRSPAHSCAVEDRARRSAGPAAGARGHARRRAARHRGAVAHRGRTRPRRGAAKGRPERQRDVAQIRPRGAGG